MIVQGSNPWYLSGSKQQDLARTYRLQSSALKGCAVGCHSLNQEQFPIHVHLYRCTDKCMGTHDLFLGGWVGGRGLLFCGRQLTRRRNGWVPNRDLLEWLYRAPLLINFRQTLTLIPPPWWPLNVCLATWLLGNGLLGLASTRKYSKCPRPWQGQKQSSTPQWLTGERKDVAPW